jgi:hypothetical protein
MLLNTYEYINPLPYCNCVYYTLETDTFTTRLMFVIMARVFFTVLDSLLAVCLPATGFPAAGLLAVCLPAAGLLAVCLPAAGLLAVCLPTAGFPAACLSPRWLPRK